MHVTLNVKNGYTKNTERLCQAIVDFDLDAVKEWPCQESTNPNDRDHTGRAPLHLAGITSTPEIDAVPC